jgi:hypothetical protein
MWKLSNILLNNQWAKGKKYKGYLRKYLEIHENKTKSNE